VPRWTGIYRVCDHPSPIPDQVERLVRQPRFRIKLERTEENVPAPVGLVGAPSARQWCGALGRSESMKTIIGHLHE